MPWFVRHSGMRHPAELGNEEIGAFLGHLATESGVAAKTSGASGNSRAR